MSNFNKKIDESSRIKGSLFGFFVGDALGVPVEFVEREVLKRNPVTTMLEYGTHNQPIGTWSDDTSMTIATIDSLIQNKCIDYKSIMDNFLKWYENGEYTPNNNVFDIGNATLNALKKYQNDKTNFLCGSTDVYSNGNGSLMRILPISLYLHYNNDPMFDTIKNISSMTHAHIYSIFSCCIYSVFINEYLKEFDIEKAYNNMQLIIRKILENNDNEKILGNLNDLKQKFYRLIYENIKLLNENDIKSSGFVIDTLESSIWCVLNTNNYKDAVLKAVNLGEDTDTIGALTGGLAGLIYGYDAIPKPWIDVLKNKEYLVDIVNTFDNLFHESNNKKDLKDDEIISMLWSNGLGDMNKYFNGENPLPKKEKKATIDSWKCKPFSSYKKINCSITLKKDEFNILSMGHIPEVMEDHWFMYCDENSVNYFRSWTGIQIFKGYFKPVGDSYIIYLLEINDNTDEYSEKNINNSLNLFNNLITAECKTYK